MNEVEQFVRSLEVESMESEQLKATSVRFPITDLVLVEGWAKRYGLSRTEMIRRFVHLAVSLCQKERPLSNEEVKAAYESLDAE